MEAASHPSYPSAPSGARTPPPSFAESTQGYQTADTTSLPPKYGSLPPEELALTSEFSFASQAFVSGGSRTPDLTVSVGTGQKLYSIETDSTLVYHETFVKDLRGPYCLFKVRRYPVQDMPDGTWRYTIHTNTGSKDKHGTKILEIDTDPGMLLSGRRDSWQTRLIFRNVRSSELDGLTLSITQEGSNGRGVSAEVLYQGKRVADIIDQRRKEPGFEIRVFRENLDLMLIVMLVYVMDDRMMGSKRRNRRSAAAGLPGIGRGPGAGLAGAYALGSII